MPIIIIGAGAAGLFAALAAVKQGKKVTVYEKMHQPGIKLSLAGGGHCNISNTGDLLAGLHGTRFLRPALQTLGNVCLRDLLQSIGVETKEDQVGRVYPKDINGRGLADFLRSWLEAQGVTFYFDSPLTDIDIQDGLLQGLGIKGRTIPAANVILACGGNTWPKTGSDGAILRVLEKAGHRLVPLLPGLAPLKTKEVWPTEAKGISLRNVNVTITGNGKKLDQTQGDLLFTHFGLSGPAILDASHAAAKARYEKMETHVIIDILPQLSTRQIIAILNQHRQKTVTNALSTQLPGQLAKALGSDDYIKGLAPLTLEKLARGLKETRLEVVDVLGKNHAMVSQGGVSLKEVDPRTMESKLIPGLFITGEMLDYHGRTGGFNLHGAFATGWLAGSKA